MARGLANYWGYNTIGFFAPHAATRRRATAASRSREFKQMVKDFHAAGLEVILDVVYNHTAEGGTRRPDAVASAGSTTVASTTGSTTRRPATPYDRHLLGRHRLRQHRRRREPRRRCG